MGTTGVDIVKPVFYDEDIKVSFMTEVIRSDGIEIKKVIQQILLRGSGTQNLIIT